MEKDVLGFGIIGCGMIANWHADSILGITGTRLIGAADLNENAMTAFTKKYGIKAYASIEKLLEDPEIDVVCICTPSGLHAPISIKAANAGKHIIVEKPMAITLSEADEMMNACKKNNMKLTVIFQSRFFDSVKKVKAAVDKGALGKLISGDVYMKFYRSEEYYSKSSWKGTWRMDGGGALMNQGIHGVDLLLYIMGPVKSVFAHARTMTRHIEVEDTAAALVEFKNGALGVIQGATSIYPGSPRRIEINGDKGTIVLEEDNIASWEIEGQEQPGDIGPGTSSNGSCSNPADFDIQGHEMQIRDFADAVKNDRKPLVDQHEGIKSLQLIMAIYESSRTGKPVEL